MKKAGLKGARPSSPGSGDVLAAFESTGIPRRSGSVLYSVGLVLVTLIMVVLPLVYIAFIGLVGFGVYAHAIYGQPILESGSFWPILVGYFGPLVVGFIGVIFLIKPLFARPQEPPQQFLLNEENEAEFTAFVYGIADVVGAPRPREIELDCQVNAAASFRGGFSGLVKRELKLVIGMPLIAGMTIRSFSGIVAHEFGHFSQGFGLSLTYIIRQINFWFSRVVYERDQFDIWLSRAAEEWDFRFGIILHMARLFVWISRRVLWVLMMVGHAVSCFALRQMEFDADSFEAGFSGSTVFRKTVARLHQISVASQISSNLLSETWSQGRISNNLPDLITRHADSLDPEILRSIEESLENQRTGILDTHPCDKDRIRAAERLERPGIFRLEKPAKEILRDYEGLSRAVSLHYYTGSLGLNVTGLNLVSNDVLLAEGEEMDAEVLALHHFFLGKASPLRPLFVTRDTVNAESVPLGDAIEERDRVFGELQSVFESYEEVVGDLDSVTAAIELAKSGFRIEAVEFGLKSGDFAYLSERHLECKTKCSQLSKKLRTFDQAALAVLVATLKRDQAVLKKAEKWLDVCSVLQALSPDMQNLRMLVMANSVLLQQFEGSGQMTESCYASIRSNANSMNEILKRIQPRIKAVAYPFEHSRSKANLWAFVETDSDEDLDPAFRSHIAARSVFENIERLHQRVLGQLCLLGKIDLSETLPPDDSSPMTDRSRGKVKPTGSEIVF